MNNVYDQAHRLARSIKASDEYKALIEKKKILDANEKNKEMVEDYKKKAFKIQMEQMSGKEVNQEEIESIKRLEEILMLNQTVREFLETELRFSQLVQDISKIIGEAVDITKD